MIEMRWLTEHWEEYPENSNFCMKEKSEPRLQYRTKPTKPVGLSENIDTIWSDWIDVPAVHVDI